MGDPYQVYWVSNIVNPDKIPISNDTAVVWNIEFRIDLKKTLFASLGHNSLKVIARESQTRGPHWNLSWQQLQTLRNSGSKHSSCLLITSQTENTPSQRSALAQPSGVGLGSTEKCRVQVPSPKKGLKGLLSPTQKIEGERKVPSCI